MSYFKKIMILSYISRVEKISDLLLVYTVLPRNIENEADAQVWNAYRERLSAFYGNFSNYAGRK